MCIVFNVLKLFLSIAIVYLFYAALVAFHTQENFIEVLVAGTDNNVAVFESALKNLTAEIPIVGKVLGFFFSLEATPNINPSTGFEEFLSFVVLFPVLTLTVTPIFSIVSKYTESKEKLSICGLLCSGINVVSNVFCLAILSLVSVAVTVSILRTLLDWLRSIVSSPTMYDVLLLIIGIAITCIYCGVRYAIKKDILNFITNLVVDFSLSLIVMTIAYTMATVVMAGGRSFLPESTINGMGFLMLGLCCGLIFMMHLKNKYKTK